MLIEPAHHVRRRRGGLEIEGHPYQFAAAQAAFGLKFLPRVRRRRGGLETVQVRQHEFLDMFAAAQASAITPTFLALFAAAEAA